MAPLETHLVAAYIVGRRVTFAGAPVTLARLSQMWKLPFEPEAAFINEAVLAGVAKYLRMSVPDLRAAVRNMPPPAPPLEVSKLEVAQPEPVTVTVTSEAPAPTHVPEPTQVIPREQLDELRQASRDPEPSVDSSPEIVISFDDAEGAEGDSDGDAASAEKPVEASEASTATEKPSTPSTKKSRRSGKKKSR